MASTALPAFNVARPLPATAQPLLRALALLLAVCLVLQGLAISTRRAMGPGHVHLRTTAGPTVLQDESRPHQHDDASLPFFGHLRSHALPVFHSDVEYHRHAAGTVGVVTVTDNGVAPGIAAWAAMLRSVLDLPMLLVPPVRLTAPTAHAPWPSSAAAAFLSRSTAPPLRPPRH